MDALIRFSLLAFWGFFLVGAIASGSVTGQAVSASRVASLRAADGIFKGRVNGALEYHRTLSKHNLPIPDGLQRAVDRHLIKMQTDQGGSVPAASQRGDIEYTAPVGIGTPPQLIVLDFDTGSADTWVLSNDTAARVLGNQTIWDIQSSTTAERVPNCTWSIMYGDFSSSSGIVYRDTLTMGDLAIPGMTIESARSVSAGFTREPEMSGLLGLAFGSAIQTKPPQRALVEFLGDSMDEPIFTSDLRHNSSQGTYNFGYIDPNLNGSEFLYLDVNSSHGFWGVNFVGFSFTGSPVSYEFEAPRPVILDTGSTLMYAPDEAVRGYYLNVPGANFSHSEYGWLLPCDVVPPDFIWELAGSDGGPVIQGVIPGQYFIYAVTDNDTPSGPMCFGGLQSSGDGMPDRFAGIFGDVFLKSSVQVWDVGQTRVGFADKKDSLNLDGYNITDTGDGQAKAQGGHGGAIMPRRRTTRVII